MRASGIENGRLISNTVIEMKKGLWLYFAVGKSN